MKRSFIDAPAQLNAQADCEAAATNAPIDTEVPGRIAALTGQVNSCLAQWAAERAVKRASGTRGVPSDIGAASAGSIRLSEADITRSAQIMLQSITLLPPGCIKVVVDGGWITLSGSVHWNYQKQAAAAAVRHAIGAIGVTDGVTLVEVGPVPATRSSFGSIFGWR